MVNSGEEIHLFLPRGTIGKKTWQLGDIETTTDFALHLQSMLSSLFLDFPIYGLEKVFTRVSSLL